jgi:hypothetical protein
VESDSVTEQKTELHADALIAQVSFFSFAKAAPNLITYSHWLTSGAGVAIGFFMSSQVGDAVAKSVEGRVAALFLVSALVYAAAFYWNVLPMLVMIESRDEGIRIAKNHVVSERSWFKAKRFTLENAPFDVRCSFGKAMVSRDGLALVSRIARQMRLARRLLLSQLGCMVVGAGLLATAKIEIRLFDLLLGI